MIENERKKKIAIVNVFFPPQSIGGATRVVSDNIDVLLSDYRDRFELVAFTSDATESEPHHLKVYAYKGIRVYRTSVLWRVNMDWHERDSKMAVLFDEFLALEQPEFNSFSLYSTLNS